MKGTKKDVNDVEARVAELEALVAAQATTIASLQTSLAAESVNAAQDTDLADLRLGADDAGLRSR